MERDPSTTKIMPHDTKAEQAVIGGLLMDNNSMADVLEVISRTGEEFYSTANREIFTAAISLIDKGGTADLITIADKLQSKGSLDLVGGYLYLNDLFENAISSANISHYAKIIKGKYVERMIISESSRLIEAAYNPTESTEEVLAETQKTILDLSINKEKNTLQPAKEIARNTIKLIEARYERKEGMVIGIPTRFSHLDNLTGGLIAGDLWIVAARPGMGKSAFAVDIAYHAALRDYKAAIFSLEMPSDALMTRILASMTKIDSRHLSRGYIFDDQWPKLTAATDRIAAAPLHIDDKPAITPTEILAKCRKMKANGGVDLVVVDYLQLMKLPGKHSSREQEVSEISRSMKLLAREIGVPVIALSQLNRNLEQRPDKRPNLGDLRESGAIEQDADIVTFIYRDELYHEDSPEKGIAEIIIGKHRNGPTGTVKLTFLEKFTRFENLAEGE